MLTARCSRSAALRSTGSLITGAPTGTVIDECPLKVSVRSVPALMEEPPAEIAVIVGMCRAECDGGNCKRRGDHTAAQQVSPGEQAARPRISRKPAARRSFDTHPRSSLIIYTKSLFR